MRKVIFILTLFWQFAWATPDWSQNARVPIDGRKNILELSEKNWLEHIRAGQIHTQNYPVDITGALPPLAPTEKLISVDKLMRDLGLQPYPAETDDGVYSVAYPNGRRPTYGMGFGTLNRDNATGFTFSCAACHSSSLFGKTVLGLTNRATRAQDFFLRTKKWRPIYNPVVFQALTDATTAETNLMTSALKSLDRVAAKKPLQLGLDTSLAQVALSLNLREDDAYATPNLKLQQHPRPDAILDHDPADSKPAVWWNVKYKNKWLSDGSLVSGNPIYTNILWNEIGRGSDLHSLEDWLNKNSQIIDELTAAVFASEPPRFTDFFDAEKFDLSGAQRGEIIFNNTCAECHGVYQKAWSAPNAMSLNATEKLRTTHVIPRPNTPIEDVGTDPYRAHGMRSLEKLNRLAISQKHNMRVEPHEGYVPPPLVGIWARWPYLHNDSIPNLCELLTPGPQRVSQFYIGPAADRNLDFDSNCNGYPTGKKTPKKWRKSQFLYDNSRVGLSNRGHDEDIFSSNGVSKLTNADRRELILFLQTL